MAADFDPVRLKTAIRYPLVDEVIRKVVPLLPIVYALDAVQIRAQVEDPAFYIGEACRSPNAGVRRLLGYAREAGKETDRPLAERNNQLQLGLLQVLPQSQLGFRFVAFRDRTLAWKAETLALDSGLFPHLVNPPLSAEERLIGESLKQPDMWPHYHSRIRQKRNEWLDLFRPGASLLPVQAIAPPGASLLTRRRWLKNAQLMTLEVVVEAAGVVALRRSRRPRPAAEIDESLKRLQLFRNLPKFQRDELLKGPLGRRRYPLDYPEEMFIEACDLAQALLQERTTALLALRG